MFIVRLCVYILGHSKCGVYVCKYADVCIRHASVRRTWEGNLTIKMIVFKIVEGKKTAALVRKGPKLQPISPTVHFTCHSSVITPKETDDLEKQFDQSQIFLYEFKGRETVKRPHHCLPYAIVSLIQDGSQWPTNFDDLGNEPDILETDTLRVIAQADDPSLQNKLKENVELAEAATLALQHVYEEDLPAPSLSPPSFPVVEGEQEQQLPQLLTDSETIPTLTTTSSDNTSTQIVNGVDSLSSPAPLSEHLLTTTTTIPFSTEITTDITNGSLNSTVIPPPPPSPPSSSATPSASKTPTPSEATVIPLSTSGAAMQAAYRQQTGLLGALPGAAALRSVPGSVYATTAGLMNGHSGQIVYGGMSADALRSFGSTAAGSAATSYVLTNHAGQTVQQPALYAAQLQAIAQQQQQHQQQAAQLAAFAAAQQQQQQSLMNGIPAGCMLVRTANGGYALLAQSPTAAAAALQAQAPLAQQQYFSINAAGQPTAVSAGAGGRFPVAFVGGQPQQVMYQYAGQPTMQAAPTQYIQLPSNYAQQQQAHQQLSTSPVMQSTASAAAQAYTNQPTIQYISASQSANNSANNSSSNSMSSMNPSGTLLSSSPTSAMISPQKQSAASATAAALQQQQQYQHAQYSTTSSQQQQQQHQSVNTAHGTNVYYAAIAQAQAQYTAQVQAQQQAAMLAQQQQQLNLVSQMPYATQQGVPQQMYYATPGGQTIYQAGGQSYVLSQPGTTTTGAPAIYSAGPALHNGATQQQNQQQSIAYQIAAAANGQPTNAAYQMLTAASNGNVPTSQQTSANAGVVVQQSAQLAQRPSVLSQMRHHPYRN
ncbi:hypothetical protein I4U23_017882 [Adineta vaga]|nr:hypothetical protein I4U23_017882 [Adineta vaga]